MKKHGRKTAGVLCALCTAALLAGCAGTETGATQGDTSVHASSEAATVADSTAPEAASVEESAAPADVPAENSVTDVMPAYAREEYTLVRNARDGKTVCYFGERTEELPGEEQEPFYANTTNGTVIRTSESAYRFKNGEITDLHISPNEFIAASPEADNILFFEAAQSPSPEVKGYGAAYLLRGEDRIPLFEADGSKLMVSGSWSPNGAYYIYSLYDTKEERYAVMLFDGSASEEITSDTSFFPVIKVSNDGHTAYFRSSGEAGSGEAELYSISDGEIRTLGPVLLSGYIFSYDGTDMIWQDNTGWKLSVGGNAPLALTGEYTYIAPVNTITQTHVQTVGADTFLNTFYYDPAAASVYRINAAGESELCLERVSADYMLAEDAKTFLYISDGSLYRADLTAAEAMPEKVVEEEVLYFTASKNASMIAYIDGEERLMLKKGSDAPVCLLEQAKDTRAYQEGNNPWYGCVTYLPDADSFYYLDEGAVCLTNDGVDIAKKDDFTGDAIYLFGMPGYLTVYTDENGSIHQYFTLDGVNFHTFS